MEIYVYADWLETDEPVLVGTLRSEVVRGKEHFSFTYDDEWLTSPAVHQIDPDLHLYPGEQHTVDENNFKVFLDSCPDRWGQLLMSRREGVVARRESRRPKRLMATDYLLGVNDSFRMGALRFKTDPTGPFLNNDRDLAAPAITSLPELQHAAKGVECAEDQDNPDYLQWLNMLISPGSSLGGARPKALVKENDGSLWLAKFPSRYDDYNIGLWEYITYQMAIDAGIQMAECKAVKVGDSEHHVFLTKRFDRTEGNRRIHFTSAMTQLQYFDGNDDGASYLELAEFLFNHGSQTKDDLRQLWTRMLFNIMVSNCDDHLRNHGFILNDDGCQLSPAYDINPALQSVGLHLNIDDMSNELDPELALEVAPYFQLDEAEAQNIQENLKNIISQWEKYATTAGASRGERQLMEECFIY